MRLHRFQTIILPKVRSKIRKFFKDGIKTYCSVHVHSLRATALVQLISCATSLLRIKIYLIVLRIRSVVLQNNR